MDKKDALRNLTRGQGQYTCVLLGRAYDLGVAAGRELAEEVVQEAFREGFHQANVFGSKAFIANTCLALYDDLGFTQEQLQNVCDAIQKRLLNSLSTLEAIEECENKFGLRLVDDTLEEPEED